MANSVSDLERTEISKRLGALPVILQVLRKLDIREIVDRYCPIREVADYTHGQMAEIFILNRLTAPHPLYRFDLWAEEFAVAELCQIDSAKLNDDRLGRSLDVMADFLEAINAEIALRAVTVFGLSLEQAHLDITSFLFEGVYKSSDPEYPMVKRGYNAEKDFKRRQVKAGQAVLKDGNVPIFFKVFDGNRTDSNTLMQVFEGLEFLRSVAKPQKMINVGDSKLLSAGNLLLLLEKEALFVGPGERGKGITEELLALDPEKWVELSYASEAELLKRKNAHKDDWNRYWFQEAPASIRDPKSGNEFLYRKLTIRSSEEMRATKKNRERQLQKAEEELEKLANGIPRYYKTEQAVQNKAASILEARRVTDFIKFTVGTRDGQLKDKAGRSQAAKMPTLVWNQDPDAIAKAERISGCCHLLTNLPAERTPNEVLQIHKDQYRVEQRFANWKGPLEVTPIFLKSNRRIAALLLVTGLALMIFSLIEREVRRELGDKDGYAVGFIGERRKSRPTGTTIFYVLRVVTALITRGEPKINRVLNIPPLVQKIHDIFEVKIEQIIRS